MDNYKDYIEERLEGMYESYNSVILEGFKKQKNYQKADMVRNDFFRYLKDQYPDFDKKEFTNAKTKEEATAVANKYKDDFERFLKKQPKRIIPLAVHLGILAADFAGIIPKDVGHKLYKILLIDDVIYFHREITKGFKK